MIGHAVYKRSPLLGIVGASAWYSYANQLLKKANVSQPLPNVESNMSQFDNHDFADQDRFSEMEPGFPNSSFTNYKLEHSNFANQTQPKFSFELFAKSAKSLRNYLNQIG